MFQLSYLPKKAIIPVKCGIHVAENVQNASSISFV